MKKTAVIIITIAVLGLLGVIDKSQAKSHQLVSPSLTGAATSSNAAQNMPSSSNMPPASGSSSKSMMASKYKDGTFTGDTEYTPYGPVQISVVVSGGKINDVNFLQMPNDYYQSQQRTQYSEPLLKQTTLSAQSSNIDFVSGATSTSMGYQQSLQSALNHAAIQS